MNEEMQVPEGNAGAGDETPAMKPMAESASPAGERAEEGRPADPKSADDVMTKTLPSHEEGDRAVLAESRRQTRRAFVVGAVGAGAAWGLYRYLDRSTSAELQPPLLRETFRANASISRGVFRDAELSPTYPLSRAETLRVNGIVGLKRDLVPESWRLQLVGMKDQERHPAFVKDVTAWEYRYGAGRATGDEGHDTKEPPAHGGGAKATSGKGVAPMGLGNAPPSNGPMPPEAAMAASGGGDGKAKGGDDGGPKDEEDDNHLGRKPRGMGEAGESNSTLPAGTPGLLLQMPDVTRLPRQELVTQFKCIEGWSQIVHWAGVRMRDFLEMYPPALVDGKEPRYVYLETPDGDYYVGYDMEVMRNPQTLLVTEMMGAPLTELHGAPLRLHTPIKYGYKQIKRIGLIAYTHDKPDDYWTKLGYDWYAGL